MRILAPSALLVATALAVLSCGSSDRSFMDDALPPCVPFEGALNEPCERRIPWSIDTYPDVVMEFSYDIIGSGPLDPLAEFRRDWEREGLGTPQVILRGLVDPGSTRCTEVLAWQYSSGEHQKFTPESNVAYVVCYMDIAVREYIVNRGPARLEVVVGWIPGVGTDEEGYGTPEYFGTFEKRISKSVEGIEFIFNLVQPWNLVHGAWHIEGLWDVQRRDDGAIVGVSWWIDVFRGRSRRSDFEYPLAELQRKLRDAHATVSAEYDGRLTGDPNSPKIVADAHRDTLLAQLREFGAYDVPGITPIAPPPSPSLPLPPTDFYGVLWTDPQPEVDLAWTAPVSSQVTTYKIMRVDSLGTEIIVAEIPSEFVEVTDRHLPIAGAEYTYTVIAVNRHGESPPSGTAVIRNGSPNAPTGFEVWLQPDNEADMEWFAPASSYVTGYRIDRKTGNGPWTTIKDNLSTEYLNSTDWNLQSGTTYTYRVVALNGWSESAPSAPYVLRVP